MAGQMGTGSAEGLYEFCDWLIKKGLLTSSAVEPLRSATKQIVSTVDADVEASTVNLGEATFDVDDYMNRFEKIAGSKYAPDSLNAYRRRFRRAIELYRHYLNDGPQTSRHPPVGPSASASSARMTAMATAAPRARPPAVQSRPRRLRRI